MAKLRSAKGSKRRSSRKPVSASEPGKRGTKSIANVGLYFPGSDSIPVCKIAIMPGSTAALPQYSLVPKPPSRTARKVTERGVSAEASKKKSKREREWVIRIACASNTGGQSDVFRPISPSELSEVRVLQEAIAASKGLHISACVPRNEILSHKPTNCFFLAPIDEGESFAAYHALHRHLIESAEALVGRWHKSGSVPIAIIAVAEGLVMYQLVEVGGVYRISEILNTGAWMGSEPSPAVKTAVVELLNGVRMPHAEPDRLEDPVVALLRALAANAERKGTRPLPCSSKAAPDPIRAAAALKNR